MHSERERKKGIIEVVIAYFSWGFLPLFWNLLDEVPAFYILFSRALWSLAFCAVYLTVLKKWGRIKELFQDRKIVLRCLFSGIFICINWGDISGE